MLVAAYVSYMVLPVALRGREGVDVLVSAAVAGMLLTLPVALVRAVVRAVRRRRWDRWHDDLTRRAAAAAKSARERDERRSGWEMAA